MVESPYETLDEVLRHGAIRWRGRPALIAGPARYSYGELDARVDAIAAALAEAGLAPGDRAAVTADGSAAAVIALAAVMRAGACAVPIDPAHPESRRAELMRDAGCRLTASPGLVPTTATAPVGARPDAPAYAIYTSGSTGRPKAVVVGHAAAVRHAAAAADLFELTPDDRVLQFASLSFDVAQEEIWPTWLAGGTVVMRPRAVPDTAALGRLVAEHGITVLQLPTAYWRAVLADSVRIDPAALRALRLVVIGGEAASLADVHRWRDSPFGDLDLINGYGPTECVVTATAFRLGAGDPLPATGGGLPIGSALPGRRLWILDEAGRPVPAGSAGELYVGGLLADGYLGRPELTAERFGEIEVGGERHRAYRTGDLVRECEPGVLEFFGRLDNQVKVRGYRIELEEIDAALRDCPGVDDAATVLLRRPSGEPMLAALIVGETASVTAEASRRLPVYMLPAATVAAERLPLTTSGKVDRPAAQALVAEALAARPAPREEVGDSVVARLRTLWGEILDAEVGPDDDFFALGGDSLLVMRMSALGRARGLQIKPADLMNAPTPAALARRISGRARPRAASPAAARGGPLPLLPAQLRWLYDGELPDMHHFALNALLRVPAGLSTEAVLDTARILLAEHPVLRSRITSRDGVFAVELTDATAADHVQIVDLAGAGQAAVEDRLARYQLELDLTAGRGFRLVHLRLGDRPGRLFVLVHHLLLDGWSMALLMDDVDTALTAAVRTGRATLPPPTAGPHELARAYADYVGTTGAREDAAAWLAMPWATLDRLPQDGKGPGRLPSIHTTRTPLSAADTGRLLFGLPRSAARPATLLRSAIQVAAAAWSGQRTQGIDVYGHNRDTALGDLDLSRSVGYIQATSPDVRDIAALGLNGVLAYAAESGPSRRFSFDALRFGSPDPGERARLRALPSCPMRLNYRGQLDRIERRADESLLSDAGEDTGAHRSPRQWERYQLMFEGDVIDGRFVVGLKYSTDHYEPERARQLADDVAELLAQAAKRLAA
jgi:amino acid adenylation domain-containing protein